MNRIDKLPAVLFVVTLMVTMFVINGQFNPLLRGEVDVFPENKKAPDWTGEVRLEKDDTWSYPLEFIPNYKSYEWRIVQGQCDRIMIRDAEQPSLTFTQELRAKTVTPSKLVPTNYIYRPQWKVEGKKEEVPIVIKYRIY